VIEPNANLGMSDAHEDESWKNEIASRLDTYRSKSKRKLSGNFSMRFDFEGEVAGPRQPICVRPEAETGQQEAEVEPQPESAESHLEAEPLGGELAPEPLDVKPVEPPPPPARSKPSVPFKRKIVMEANVIEFPRLFPPEPSASHGLAEPMMPSSPRILDAPEIAEPLRETPMLDGMRLEQIEAGPPPELELPLQVAPVASRLYAALADALIVLAGSAVFYGVAYKMLAGIEWSKPLLAASAVIPVILWAVYQYLFLVYGARTPGMAMTHLSLSTFTGTAPNQRERRMRIIGLALSCSSLMLGFVWVFFDEDMLCWHDRISRTYTFRQQS
jgi:uncharacterized RDD family membrane protein YckC